MLTQIVAFLRNRGAALDALPLKKKSPDVVSAVLRRASKLADACQVGPFASQVEVVSALVHRVTVGQDKAQVMAETPQSDHLDRAEISAAIEALTTAEKLKLSAIDEMMWGGTGFGKGELVQESVLRALGGSRKCPRHVPIMAFCAMPKVRPEGVAHA